MIIQGDALTVLKTLESESVQCCVTSPPYYALRDYGIDGQIGLEETPEKYIEALVSVFHEVHRVLKNDGTLWINIADSYWGSGSRGCDFTDIIAEKDWKQGTNKGTINLSNLPKCVGNVNGYKSKDLIGIPWMLAFALRADGYYLRQDIIWHKPNPMPESVTDRFTKSHEYVFLFSKQPKYYFNHDAVQEIATGYDGRTDTMMKGAEKYANETYLPEGVTANTFASRGHERWKYKNLAEKGQQPNTMHIRRANGEKDVLYPVRNMRDVWRISTKPFSGSHFATFPEELAKNCIRGGSKEGDTVLDVFSGAATTGVVCIKEKREYIGIELNPQYVEISEKRLADTEAEFGVEINQISMF